MNRAKRASTLERAYVVLAVVWMSGAFESYYAVSTESFDSESNIILIAFQLLIYGAMIMFGWPTGNSILRNVRGHAAPFLTLCTFAVVSSAWSSDPIFTLRRSTVLLLTLVFSVYLATRFSIREQVQLLAFAIALIVVGSIVANYLTPPTVDDAWIGIFPHKNGLGMMMGVGVLSFCLMRCSSSSMGKRMAGVAVCGTLLYLSQSVTSAAAILTTLFIWPILAGFRGESKKAVAFAGIVIILFVACGVTLLLNADDIAPLFGRDSSLTGRIPMWMVLGTKVMDRPVLGYGFSGFWHDEENSGEVLYQIGWGGHAHNGYVDLALSVGVIGIVLFVYALLVSLKKAVLVFRHSRNSESSWPFLFLIFFCLHNVAESSIIKSNNILWLLFVTASVSASVYLKSVSTTSPISTNATSALQRVPVTYCE